MHVTRLALTDFRNYRQVDLGLSPGVTAFIGSNGQGKTNLVEALGYAATLSSHRVATDTPLVRQGAEKAVIRAGLNRDARDLTIEIEINPGKRNRARLAGVPLPRPREVIGTLRVVSFAPEDLAMVKGDPAERRRYLDELLTARAPRFAGVRADYDRVLKQRGALLKTAGLARRGNGADLRTLDVWDSHLVSAGVALLTGRLALLDALNPLIDKAYASLAPGCGPTSAQYRSSFSAFTDAQPASADPTLLSAAFTAALAAARPAELERGVSLVGPHRDDMVLSVGELPVRGYASHGESWTFALALRLAAFELLRADGTEPVLVLDDVFAELDADRRSRLAEAAATAEQVLITAAVPADVPEKLFGARFDVADGVVHSVC
ncbi:MAG: DNA replication/repair protein RecF [Mycobacteriales bacterium]